MWPFPFSSWREDDDEVDEMELSRELSLVGDDESPASTSPTKESSVVAVDAVTFKAVELLLVLLLFVEEEVSLAEVAIPMSLFENTLQFPVVISIIIIFA